MTETELLSGRVRSVRAYDGKRTFRGCGNEIEMRKTQFGRHKNKIYILNLRKTTIPDEFATRI